MFLYTKVKNPFFWVQLPSRRDNSLEIVCLVSARLRVSRGEGSTLSLGDRHLFLDNPFPLPPLSWLVACGFIREALGSESQQQQLGLESSPE